MGSGFPSHSSEQERAGRSDLKTNRIRIDTPERSRATDTLDLYVPRMLQTFSKYLQNCGCDNISFLPTMSLDCDSVFSYPDYVYYLLIQMSLMTFTAFLDPYPFCLIRGISSCAPSHILCFLQTGHIPQTCSPCMLFIGFFGIPQPSFKTQRFFVTFIIFPKLVILSQAPLLP